MTTHLEPCIVCSGTKWTALPDPGSQSMASDWRIVAEPLARMVCDDCGLARRVPTDNGLSLFESGYELYARVPGEVRERARQDAYAAWIAGSVPTAPVQVLDVGCGNGSLLRALRAHWPGAAMLGCDPSAEAIEHGASDDLRLWRGQALDLPPGLVVDLVITVNVIEHTPDPRRFISALRDALDADGRLIVVCPDGSHPGLELLFADHLFSFTPPHLEALLAGAGMETVATSRAPAALGAFQMAVARRSPERRRQSRAVPGRVPGRAEYLERWRDLDGRLLERLGRRVVCFGAGEAAGLLRAYAPRSWSRVVACAADAPSASTFGTLPVMTVEQIDPNASLLLGVRPDDQPQLRERLQARFPHVVEWYDLIA